MKFTELSKTFWKAVKENVISITSLVITFSALIVAVATLKVANSSLASAEQSKIVAEQSCVIAEQSLILSSRDLTPVFEFEVDGKTGDFYVKNLMPHLFIIEGIDIYEISSRGVELAGRDSITSFSLLTKSGHFEDRHIWFFNKDEKDSTIISLNINKSLMYASMQTVYDKDFMSRVDGYLNCHYSFGSTEGYALPAQYSSMYLLDVWYRDKVGQVKDVFLIQQHIHGRGWWKDVITEEEFDQYLREAEHQDIDSLTNIDSIMHHLLAI